MNIAVPSSGVLDILCPMHLLLNAKGVILHAGPTIQKLRPKMPLEGMAFLDAFEVLRPRGLSGIEELLALRNLKLHLKMVGQPPAELKGVMIKAGQGQIIVNLSFGISILHAVRDYSLSNADFAPTDLAIEMLYLVEAKSAAMEASQMLNKRLQGAKNVAEEQAFTDTLTDLRNRRALDQVLERLLSANRRFAVMHIDLDFFKAVNDTHGHAAGDHVLKQVARVMLEETRKTDTVARVGGDEFTVVLPDVSDVDVLERIGARIIEQIERPVEFNGELCEISASIGTVWIQSGRDATRETILEEADIALYASKKKGRACQTFYTPALREGANKSEPPNGRDLKEV